MATHLGINNNKIKSSTSLYDPQYESRILEKTGVVIGMALHSNEKVNVIAVKDINGNTFLIAERGLKILSMSLSLAIFFEEKEFQIS
jgi:hypothetical protein